MSERKFRETLNLNPTFLKPFEFEKTFDYQKWSHWTANNWHWSIYISIIYVLSIFYGQMWMSSRPPLRLKKILIVWNIGLCLLSFLMFSRIFPELWYELNYHGVYHAICNADNHSLTSAMWLFIFSMSKMLEFGDTAFIIARKQKLIFLHWYHHTTVFIYCFTFYAPFETAARLTAPINTFIHTIMYGYYAFKAMEFKVPTQLSKIITTLQITQMVIGCLVNASSIFWTVTGKRCDRSRSSLFWGAIMFGSYLILFIKFFNTVYKKPTFSKDKSVPNASNKPKLN